jgi:hypothetical protein
MVPSDYSLWLMLFNRDELDKQDIISGLVPITFIPLIPVP